MSDEIERLRSVVRHMAECSGVCVLVNAEPSPAQPEFYVVRVADPGYEDFGRVAGARFFTASFAVHRSELAGDPSATILSRWRAAMVSMWEIAARDAGNESHNTALSTKV